MKRLIRFAAVLVATAALVGCVANPDSQNAGEPGSTRSRSERAGCH